MSDGGMSESETHRQETDGPRPEPLRFFGTTWVGRDGGYAARRAGVATGALAAAVAGAFVLRFGYDGLTIADVSPFVSLLVVLMFAACSFLAFRRTWEGFVRRPDPNADPSAERSMQSIKTIGFIGSLLAWFCRSLIEAPGEKLHRAEYEREREAYDRRRATRTGNPAAKKKQRNKKRR